MKRKNVAGAVFARKSAVQRASVGAAVVGLLLMWPAAVAADQSSETDNGGTATITADEAIAVNQ